MNRRAFLRAGAGATGALALGPAFLSRAFAAGPASAGPGPYGPLLDFNADGIALPDGFTSREIARGATVVPAGGDPYTWHVATDGQATFPTIGAGGAPDGGWILVANSEVAGGGGGVSGVEFSPAGEAERAYRVLEGTSTNCAGGPTPWGSWLSCEEHDDGLVHECDPTGTNPGVSRPALGRFAHEAACVDPVGRRLYLTEDQPDGCLYRFTPDAYPDLSSGLLEVAVGTPPGAVAWAEVPDPGGGAANPAREQVGGAARFAGGEGTWHDDGVVYVTTKGDDRVWTLNLASNAVAVLYDRGAIGPDAPLQGVDNITVAPSGDVYVCEDGADNDICLITPEFEVSRFLKLHPDLHSGPAGGDNETVGVVFSPDGRRMYFGGQRSFNVGAVYEVSGPFRDPGAGTVGTGSAAAASLPGRAGISLRANRRRKARKLLRHGIPVVVESDQPVAVSATLRIKRRGGRRRKRRSSKLLARAQTGVAISGLATLRLQPTRRAKRVLAGRRRVVAWLRVVATDSLGNRTVLRQRVTILAPAKRRRRR